MNGRRFAFGVAKSYLLLMGVLTVVALLWTRAVGAAEPASGAAAWAAAHPPWLMVAAALLVLLCLSVAVGWRAWALNRSLAGSLDALNQARDEVQGLAEFVAENPSPVLRIGPDGRVRYANLAALELIPIDADGHAEDADAARLLRDCADGFAGDTRYITRGGRSWSFVALRGADGGGADLFGREITGERAATEARRESEQRMRLAVEAMGAGVWDWDLRTGEVYREPRLLSMLDLQADFPPQQTAWAERCHADDRPGLVASRRAVSEGASDRMDVQYRFRDGNGAYRWLQSHGRLIRDADGKPARVIGLVIDATRDRQNEDQMRLQAAALEAAFNAIVLTDAEGRIEWVNPAYTRISGFSIDEVRGQTPAIFETLRDGGNGAALEALIASGRVWQSEHTDRRSDGRAYRVKQMVTPLTGPDGSVSHFVAALEDVTAQREAEEEIRRLVQFDELTGLPNRTLLVDRLNSAIDRSERWSKPFALLLLDLDHFKDINDTLGHQVGDMLLKQVAQTIGGCLRTPDTLARLGGDEFAMIVEDLQDGAQASALAERIVAAFAETTTVDGHAIQISPSIGITVFPDDPGTPDDLMRNADLAMYQAKADGRGGYRFFDAEMQAAARDRLQMASDLRTAIAGEELYLCYQPKLDLGSDRLVGAEALLRWRHPEKGEVSPGLFIPVAEDSGLIVELGNWVLQRVCAQIAEWRERGLPVVPVAVNLSGIQLSQAGLADAVETQLSAHGLTPDMIEFEITETVLMQSTQRAMENLRQLDDLGVHISLDDFGTGYSSLAYLSRFPVRRLKVDMAFVQGIGRNRNDEAIVKAVVGLAHNLNIRAVAEGVETPEQIDFLRAQLCDEVQGYLLSRPLLEADFVAFLKDAEAPAAEAAPRLKVV